MLSSFARRRGAFLFVAAMVITLGMPAWSGGRPLTCNQLNPENGGMAFSGAGSTIQSVGMTAGEALTFVITGTAASTNVWRQPASQNGPFFPKTEFNGPGTFSYKATVTEYYNLQVLNAGSYSITCALPDTTSPTATITGAPSGLSQTTPFSVTVTFSEDVTGFAASDLAVTNGSAGSLSGSGASYAVTITPTGAGDVTLQVPANVATDAAGNGNTASEALTVKNRTAEETGRIIGEFLESRTRQLLGNQPELAGLFDGGGGGVDAGVTQTALNFDLSFGSARGIWGHLQGSLATLGGTRSDFVFGVIGGHLQPTENLLVGAMLQIDYVDATNGAARASGTGWLAGPYLVARLPDHPLIFDARLLYGQGQNDVSPFGTYRDPFTSDRWLAQVNLTGEIDYGAFDLLPRLRVAHGTDTARAYTDTLGNRSATQGVALTELGAALGLEVPIEVRAGEFVWTSRVEAIWASTAGIGASTRATTSSGRGRIDMGLGWRPRPLTRFSAGAFYDGVGLASYEAIGLSLSVEAAF